MDNPVVKPDEVAPRELVAALVAIRSSMTSRQLGLLEKHYHAPDASLPVDDRGQYSEIVSLYGKIGGALSRQLQRKPGKYHVLWIAFQEESESGQDTQLWRMRPNIHEALSILGWFGPSQGYRSSPAPVSLSADQFDYETPAYWHAVDKLGALLPEEVTPEEELIEGASRRVSVNYYERNPYARAKCLAHHGYACAVCSFDFEEFYGPIGRGYIHVHHIVPLSETTGEYVIDPIKDLVPVCPNCHAMIHRTRPALQIEQLLTHLQTRKRAGADV